MEQTGDILGGKPYAMTCFHQTEEQTDGSVGFIPCMVVAGQAGYYPMSGGDLQAAWIWGNSHEDCMKVCRKYNKDTLGLSEAEVRDILISAAIATAFEV